MFAEDHFQLVTPIALRSPTRPVPQKSSLCQAPVFMSTPGNATFSCCLSRRRDSIYLSGRRETVPLSHIASLNEDNQSPRLAQSKFSHSSLFPNEDKHGSGYKQGEHREGQERRESSQRDLKSNEYII